MLLEIIGSKLWFVREVSDGKHDASRGHSKKVGLGIFRSWMHIDISAWANAPCWLHSNENISSRQLNAYVQESSHSSMRHPSPSPSSISDEAEVKARLQEETDHYQRLQLYVFVVRCIACPFTAKQPTDLPKRDLQVSIFTKK